MKSWIHYVTDYFIYCLFIFRLYHIYLVIFWKLFCRIFFLIIIYMGLSISYDEPKNAIIKPSITSPIVKKKSIPQSKPLAI